METFRVGEGMRIEDVTTGDWEATEQFVAVTPGIDATTLVYSDEICALKEADCMAVNARFAAESDDEITPPQLD